MTPNDISIIFGLPLSGKSIFPLPKMSFGSIPDNCKRFVLRNFGKVDHISREHTIQRIENMLVSNETEYENDLPKLILILAIITFFFPDNQRELAWGYLQYIIDEKKLTKSHGHYAFINH